MINLNLEEIKSKVSGCIVRYRNTQNRYSWKEYRDTTGKYKDISLLGLSEIQLRARKIEQIGIDTAPFSDYSCFGRFTYGYSRKQQDSRIIFTCRCYNTVQHKTINNYCWMDEDLLHYWFDTIREESGLDFFYSIEPGSAKNTIDINFDFKSLNRYQMKFLLFWTRQIFEYPDSLCALDAIILKRDYFPDETLCNLLVLTSDCQLANAFQINPYQCLTVDGNFLAEEELKRRLTRKTATLVNSTFGHYKQEKSKDPEYRGLCIYGEKVIGFDKRVNNLFSPIKDWIDKDERFELYTRIYPVLKEHEIPYKEPKITVKEA